MYTLQRVSIFALVYHTITVYDKKIPHEIYFNGSPLHGFLSSSCKLPHISASLYMVGRSPAWYLQYFCSTKNYKFCQPYKCQLDLHWEKLIFISNRKLMTKEEILQPEEKLSKKQNERKLVLLLMESSNNNSRLTKVWSRYYRGRYCQD